MKNGRTKDWKRGEIRQDYEVHHFDEFPILFSGINPFGERVVGSFVCENEDEKQLEFFHTVIKEIDFTAFVKRAVSYIDLMKNASAIYYIKKDYSYRMVAARSIAFSEIPSDILPLPTAFFPQSSHVSA